MKIAFLGNFGPSHSTESHLSSSFEFLGHTVTRIQEGDTPALDVPSIVNGHDLFVWVQTYSLAVQGGSIAERFKMLDIIRQYQTPSVGLHLDKWWDLPREDQIATEPWFRQDVVMTADGGNQDRWESVGVNHRWLLPGVYEPEARITGHRLRHFTSDIAFVGSWRGGYHPEWPHRQQLVEWLRRNYRSRVKFWPINHAVRGEDLSHLYASARVVVGDSCLVGTRGHYHSDRIPETVGRGGFLLHPHVDGVMPNHYTSGEHLVTWTLGDWSELTTLIDSYLAYPAERQRIQHQGRQHVLANHTYTVRMQQVLTLLAEEGYLDPALVTGVGGNDGQGEKSQAEPEALAVPGIAHS